MNAVAMWGILACARPEVAPADTGAAPDTDVEVIGDTDDTDTAPPEDTGPPDDRVYAALFDPAAVGRIDLELTEEALASLREHPDVYVPANFVHERVAFLEEIGVRLKGGASTFDDIDGKPSFKLKLDEYQALDYAGLTRLNLHNMKDDASQAREVVAAAVWEAAGVPAPRASYVEVFVNGVSRGLYANVEEVDGAYVARRFADGRGDLWEAEEGADLTAAGVDHYAVVSGGGNAAALVAARQVIQLSGGEFFDAADAVLDMDGFLDVWAWSIVTANADAYPYDLDDHALYADPAAHARFVYLPTALGESWDEDMAWDTLAGIVGTKCAADAACLDRLKTRVGEALTTWETLDVPGIVTAAYAVSLPTVETDAGRLYSLQDVTVARRELTDLVEARPGEVRAALGL